MKSRVIAGMKPVLAMVMMLLLSKFGFSQDPGDNPDGPPPAVPIEDYMHLIILFAGAVLALVTVGRLQRKKA